MPHYDVYLEIGSNGTCFAHVLALPGCIVRAASEATAITMMPDAIDHYHVWLRQHGENVAPSDPITLHIAERADFGPFEHGDRAALFAPDRDPLSAADLERYLQLAGYARADLLELAQGWDEINLDRSDRGSMNIRQILRHIGNTEEWYVSRLVDPQTLPPEWADDERLPIFTFLEMERRAAIERLRRLTDHERSAVLYPKRWTDHPDEPWTARKALRRLIEHEREHTEQVRMIITQM